MNKLLSANQNLAIKSCRQSRRFARARFFKQQSVPDTCSCGKLVQHMRFNTSTPVFFRYFTCPVGRATYGFHLPDRSFYLPRAVGQPLVSVPGLGVGGGFVRVELFSGVVPRAMLTQTWSCFILSSEGIEGCRPCRYAELLTRQLGLSPPPTGKNRFLA